MRKRHWLGLLALALGGVGCSTEGGMFDEVLGTQTDAIVGGSADTVHQAAVAYLHGGKCTATIIHVSGSTGYALTAGHCIYGALGNLRQGNNHNNPDETYPVTHAERHPLYSGQPTSGHSKLYDFGMLTFSGATGSTPVMAALQPSQDSLAQGHNLDIVGYGNTVDSNSGSTSTRRHIVKPLAGAYDLRLVFNQASTGMCSGDSGGPTVRTAGQDYVAGVNSYISGPTQGQCVGNGFIGTAVRVSAVYDTFIMPYINNTPYLDQTCDQCEEAHVYAGDCTSHVEACWNNTACSNYIDCINNCTTQSCVLQCQSTHASGYAMYQQIYDCVCTTACVTECANDPMCAPPPPCGFTSNMPQCQACWEQSCCDEGNACAADPFCVECVTSITPPSGCANDAEAVAFNTCLQVNCAEPCNLGGEGGEGGTGGAGGMGGGSSTSTSTSTSTSGVGGGTSTSGVGGESSSGEPAEFTVDQGGCGCTTPGDRRLGSSLWLLALGLAAAAARRRR